MALAGLIFCCPAQASFNEYSDMPPPSRPYYSSSTQRQLIHPQEHFQSQSPLRNPITLNGVYVFLDAGLSLMNTPGRSGTNFQSGTNDQSRYSTQHTRAVQHHNQNPHNHREILQLEERSPVVQNPAPQNFKPALLPHHRPDETHPLLSKIVRLNLRDSLLLEILRKHPRCSMTVILSMYETLSGNPCQKHAELLVVEKNHYNENRRNQPTIDLEAQPNVLKKTMERLPLSASTRTIIDTVKLSLVDHFNRERDGHLTISYLSLQQKAQAIESKGQSASLEEKMRLIELKKEIARVEVFGSRDNYERATKYLIQGLYNKGHTPTQRYALYTLLSDEQHFGKLLALNHRIAIQSYESNLGDRLIAMLPSIPNPLAMRPIQNNIHMRGLIRQVKALYDPEVYDSSLPELQILRSFFMNLGIDDIISPISPSQNTNRTVFEDVIKRGLPLQKAAAYSLSARLMLIYLETTQKPLTDAYNPEIIRRKLEMALFNLDMEFSDGLFDNRNSAKQMVIKKLIRHVNDATLRLKELYFDSHAN